MVVLLVSAAPVTARGGEHVRARLVADSHPSVQGEEIWIGVHLEMDPGWHVYWSNPGDAGLATAVEWHLPDGFSAGPVQWPTPISFTQPGDLAAFGYERSVVLASQVTIPETLPSGQPTIAASVSWLACKDVCVLGGAELEERWPLEPSPDVFAGWRDRLPRTEGPYTFTTTGGIEPGERRGDLSLWLRWTETPGEVEFFPAANERLKVTDMKIQTRGGLTRIDCSVSLIGGREQDVLTLPAVVVTTTENGVRRGWEVSAPLRDDG